MNADRYNRLYPKRKGNILVIFYSHDIKDLMFGLESAGYHVNAYDKSEIALENYIPGYYNLLLLETRLNLMTGFEFYSIIKKIERISVCYITKLVTYYKSLIEFFPNLDAGCFIDPSIDIKDFLKIIDDKIN